MLPEADLFVRAEHMLVEVLGRIRDGDEDLELPEMYPGAGTTLGAAVEQHLREEYEVTRLLQAPASPGELAELAGQACAAAGQVVDGAEVVSGGRTEPAARFLLRCTLRRSLLAHYVAARLGSTACPLPEELARPLWELTAPDAASWRELGYFRAPMPLPPYVSWRDRFLLCAGHLPHPYGH